MTATRSTFSQFSRQMISRFTRALHNATARQLVGIVVALSGLAAATFSVLPAPGAVAASFPVKDTEQVSVCGSAASTVVFTGKRSGTIGTSDYWVNSAAKTALRGTFATPGGTMNGASFTYGGVYSGVSASTPAGSVSANPWLVILSEHDEGAAFAGANLNGSLKASTVNSDVDHITHIVACVPQLTTGLTIKKTTTPKPTSTFNVAFNWSCRKTFGGNESEIDDSSKNDFSKGDSSKGDSSKDSSSNSDSSSDESSGSSSDGEHHRVVVTVTGGPVLVDANGSVIVPSIPGWTCTVTEVVPAGYAVTPASGTVTDTVSIHGSNFMFTNTKKVGALTITKRVDVAPLSTPASFSFSVTCPPMSPQAVTIQIPAIATEATSAEIPNIAAGTLCTITENAADVRYAILSTTGTASIVADKTTNATFLNKRRGGTATIKKTVDVAPAGSDAKFSFQLSCATMPPSNVMLDVIVAAGTNSGTSAISTTFASGTTCTATEKTADGRYTLDAASLPLTIVADSTTTVSFSNKRKTGMVSVTKEVVGAFSGDPTTTFTYDLTCGLNPATPNTLTVGTPNTHVNLVTGTQCAVKETNVPSIFDVSYPHGDVATITDAPQTIVIRNTRKLAAISVTKTLEGGVGPANFAFSLSCINPKYQAAAPLPVLIAAGQTSGSATFAAVPFGADCTVTESSTDAGYLPAVDVQRVTSVGQSNAVSFRNVKRKSNLAITKTADPAVARPGDIVKFTVVVTNTGNYPLLTKDVVVSDPLCPLGSPTSSETAGDGIATLSINETWTYVCSTAITKDTLNRASVSFPDGTAEATAFVDIITPGIQVAKSSDKPAIRSGTNVTYTYIVTNSGDDPLTAVKLSDDICKSVTFVSGDTNSDNKLGVTEKWTYTCSQVLSDAEINVKPNQVLNTATASAVDSLQGATSSKATTTVRIIHTSLKLTRSVDKPLIRFNDTVTYTYNVSNGGDSPIHAVALSDDKCLAVTGPVSGDTNGDHLLDPNEIWVYTCTQSVNQTVTTIGTVSGLDPLEVAVPPQSVPITVEVVKPAIAITKSANATTINSGQSVTYTYLVTNVGDTPLNTVTVSDNRCSPVTGPTGDTNNDQRLDTTETWSYACIQPLTITTTNTAIVSAFDRTLTQLTAQAQATVTVATTTTTTTTSTTSTTTTTSTTIAKTSAPSTAPATTAAATTVPPVANTEQPAITTTTVAATTVATTPPTTATSTIAPSTTIPAATIPAATVPAATTPPGTTPPAVTSTTSPATTTTTSLRDGLLAVSNLATSPTNAPTTVVVAVPAPSSSVVSGPVVAGLSVLPQDLPPAPKPSVLGVSITQQSSTPQPAYTGARSRTLLAIAMSCLLFGGLLMLSGSRKRKRT
jgi:uncharacterized repeat protein (TIGR01451 family)